MHFAEKGKNLAVRLVGRESVATARWVFNFSSEIAGKVKGQKENKGTNWKTEISWPSGNPVANRVKTIITRD
jgi:hypothetical protein